MKKHLLTFATLSMFCTLFTACSKDDDDDSNETRTELLIKSTWKLDKIEAGIAGDITSSFDACERDNLLTFTASSNTATSGNGTLDEGPAKCDSGDPQSTSFTWELINNGAVLRTSANFIDGGSGDFNIVSVSSTTLVLSQQVSFDPLPATTVTMTLKH